MYHKDIYISMTIFEISDKFIKKETRKKKS